MSGSVVTSLGTLLREERRQQNVMLAEISARTRIGVAILQAIEDDQFESIPGGWYRQSFLRQYANALGLDAERVVADFKTQYDEPPLPLPIPPHRKPRRIWADLTWAAVFVIALAGLYGASEATRAVLNSRRAGAVKKASKPSPPPAAANPATPIPPDVNAPKPLSPTQTVAAPASTPPLAVHAAIKAIEPVWLSIKCDGDIKYTGVLKGEQDLDASATITAIVGNAGGLEISVNGRPVGPLGAHGEVQVLELTAAGARRISRRAD